jgi:hypothetical protein
MPTLLTPQIRQLCTDYVPQVFQDAIQRRRVQHWIDAGMPIPPPGPFKRNLVREYAATYKLKTLVETGTLYGQLLAACKDIFPRMYSIELDKSLYLRAQKRFSRNPQITILNGDSAVELPKVIAQLKEPALFWLDAHYSGGVTARSALETPIVQELDLIFASAPRPMVILIDDARAFDGSHDYPTVDYVTMRARAQGYFCIVRNDVIRITPTENSIKN